MPWCEDCSKFWNPHEMASDGSCPTCGVVLLQPSEPAHDREATGSRAKGAPWHFKLLIVGVTGYMIYRIIWFIEWLPKHV